MFDKQNICRPDLSEECCVKQCCPPDKNRQEPAEIDIRSLVHRITGGNDLFFDHFLMT